MPETDSVREGYDQWASCYDHDGNPLTALEEPLVRAAAGDVAGLAALDLGCGTGRHASWLATAGARVTAIDFSPGMLEVARSKPGADQIEYVEHDLNGEFPASWAFDLVVSGLVIEHLADLPEFFRNVRQSLRPGGHAVVSGMHPAMFLKGVAARFTDPESGEVVTPGTIEHTLGEAVMAAVRSGLTLINVTEASPDAGLAARVPRAQKYVGWPMVVVLSLWRDEAS